MTNIKSDWKIHEWEPLAFRTSVMETSGPSSWSAALSLWGAFPDHPRCFPRHCPIPKQQQRIIYSTTYIRCCTEQKSEGKLMLPFWNLCPPLQPGSPVCLQSQQHYCSSPSYASCAFYASSPSCVSFPSSSSFSLHRRQHPKSERETSELDDTGMKHVYINTKLREGLWQRCCSSAYS